MKTVEEQSSLARVVEHRKGEFFITTDSARLDLETIYRFLPRVIGRKEFRRQLWLDPFRTL